MNEKCLVVGAGAVGAVYGRHLAGGGADVTFFVKEKYKPSLSDGIDLLHYNRKNLGIQKFGNYELVSRVGEVASKKFDQVYLTVSSTALRSESIAQLVTSVNEEAIIVMLQAGLGDLSYLAGLVDKGRVVQGLITASSYQAPLPGEDLEPCIAYWFPPAAASPLSGPEDKAMAVVKALKAGNLPASYTGDLDGVQNRTAFSTAYFMPFLAALEVNDWSFDQLRKSGSLRLVDAAADQVFAITEKETGTSKPLAMVAIKSPLIGLGLRFQSLVVPFDLEVFFKYHFSKVKDQTLFYLENFIQLGQQHGLPTDQVKALYEKVK